MKPSINLATATTPDGSRFSLHKHDGEYSLKVNGTQLMGSGSTVSELLLADEACRFRVRPAAPKVLIGGLGLGFSLKRVLELVGGTALIDVAELLPEVVAWNREFLGDLNGALLEDKRVRVITGDVYDCIARGGAGHYDAILLDVDNSPTSLVQRANARLYNRRGLATIFASLRPGGRVAFWSAGEERGFLRQLRRAGFGVEEIAVKAHERARRAAHRIYSGERRS